LGGGDPRELAMKWLRQATARFAPAGLLALVAAAGPAAASDATIAAELMQPGPLPDIVEGAASAPATIVEYASMTCSHCAAFHEQVWPALKAKYVDTGKAKFILREFPLDPLAIAAFMTARCAGPDKRDALIDRLFASQQDWAFHDEPLDRLRRAAGLSPADFLACVKDKALFDGVNAERDSAATRFGLDSTPTFFVDGHKLDGEPTLTAFDAALAAPAK
jgi:protein-disulfide isomerase